IQDTLHNALTIQLPLVTVVLAGVALFLILFPLDRVLNLQTVSRGTLNLVLVLLVVELLIGVPMGVIAGNYRATGRLARGGVIGACQQALLLLLTISLILLHINFITLAAVRVGIAILFSGVILCDVHRLYPWLSFSFWEGN